MPIVETVSTAGQFRDKFAEMNRSDNFSYWGLGELFDYFDSFADNIELDVVAICCEYNEYDLEDVNREYCQQFETDKECLEYLEENTTVIASKDDRFLFAAF